MNYKYKFRIDFSHNIKVMYFVNVNKIHGIFYIRRALDEGAYSVVLARLWAYVAKFCMI